MRAGNGNHAFEIVPHDLGLPGDGGERSDACEREKMTVRRTQSKIPDIPPGGPQVFRNPDPDAHHFRAALNPGGYGAAQIVAQHPRYIFRIHSLERCLDPIHLDAESIARQDDAVFHVHHARDIANGFGHLWPQLAKQFLIVGIELDLHGLRAPR